MQAKREPCPKCDHGPDKLTKLPGDVVRCVCGMMFHVTDTADGLLGVITGRQREDDDQE